MIKQIIVLLFLLICINTASATIDYYNTSYSFYEQDFTYLAGKNVVTPHQHFNDEYFSLYNDGNARYMIYQYDYIGTIEDIQDAFIGCIEPNQMIMLTTNASYFVYADYNDKRDLGDPDIVINKIQSWWYVIIYLLLIIITIFGIWKVVRK